MKKCNQCKVQKEINNFYKHNNSKDKLRSICISCFKVNKSKYQKDNKDKNLEHQTKFRKNNPEYDKLRRERFKLKNGTSYWVIRKESDIIYKFSNYFRSRTSKLVKNKKWKKKSKFIDYIGCDSETLINHLESKFQSGMTWENHSINGWHIDHIIPLSSAKTEEELYKLCHYTNLQPLWAHDNIKKSDKF